MTEGPDGSLAAQALPTSAAVPLASASAELAELESRLSALSRRRGELSRALAQACAEGYRRSSEALDEASTGVAVAGAPCELAAEAGALCSLRPRLGLLKALRARLHGARALAASAEGAGSVAEATARANEAVGALAEVFASLSGASEALERPPLPPLAADHAGGAAAEALALRRRLRSFLQGRLRESLLASGWPPFLISAKAPESGPQAASSRSSVPALAWEPSQLRICQVWAASLTRLQLATLPEVADAGPGASSALGSPQGPALWASEALAQGLGEQLRVHFCSGLDADRADRPEWLFAAAGLGTGRAGQLAHALQPAVDAAFVRRNGKAEAIPFSPPLLCLDVPKACSEVLYDLLCTHTLPALQREAGIQREAGLQRVDALWLHFADEAGRHERAVGPLRGALSSAPEEDLALLAHPRSALEALCAEGAWQSAWLEAEARDAAARVAAFGEGASAWLPATEVLGCDATGEAPSPADPSALSSFTSACQHEFWPPLLADQALALASELLRRSTLLHRPPHREAWAEAVVGGGALEALHGLLARAMRNVRAHGALLGAAQVARLGAALCGARLVERRLVETGGLGGGALEEEDEALGVLAARAESFAELRREGTLLLAEAAVGEARRLLEGYSQDRRVFARGYDAGLPGSLAAQRDLGDRLLHPDCGEALPAPSAALLIASRELAALLDRLGKGLDAVLFRQVWKAVAVALDAMFLKLASSAVFTALGARQLESDLVTLLGAFRGCSARPRAHLSEALEASSLLCAARGRAKELHKFVRARRGKGASAEEMQAWGVVALSAAQVDAVLSQRLDLAEEGH